MIELIDKKQASDIIETRKPLGSFLRITKANFIIAIDNTTGEAWTEEFKNIEKAIEYLNSNDEIFREQDKQLEKYKNMKEALVAFDRDNKKGKTNYEAINYVDKKIEEISIKSERGFESDWFYDCLDIKAKYNIMPSWTVTKAIELIEKEVGFTVGVKITKSSLRFEIPFRKCRGE